jgi:hypothetical protein
METLEEAFEKWSSEQSGYNKLDVLRFGAKWQAEQHVEFINDNIEELDKAIESFKDKRNHLISTRKLYSEEDVKEAFRQGMDNVDYSDTYGWSSKLTEQEWLKQFKKR